MVNNPHSFKQGFQIAFPNSTKHLTNASSLEDKIQNRTKYNKQTNKKQEEKSREETINIKEKNKKKLKNV